MIRWVCQILLALTHTTIPSERKEACMARKTSKKKDELEELEDELEELEDEDEEEEDVEDDDSDDEDEDSDDEDSDDEEDEDEDEEESPKKKGKKAKKPKKRDDGKIGTAELAEALETDGRNLRVMIRDAGLSAADFPNGRYEWDSLEEAFKQLKIKNAAAGKKALKASRDSRLEKLKEDAAAKRKAEKSEGEGKTSKKKKSKK